MNYINVLGFILFFIFLLQFVSGILLSCFYSSFAGFSAVYYIMIEVNVGWLIRFTHVAGASIFMFFILFHWIRGTWIRLKLIEQIEYSLFFFFFLALYSASLRAMWSSSFDSYFFTSFSSLRRLVCFAPHTKHIDCGTKINSSLFFAVFNTVCSRFSWIFLSGLLIWFLSLAVSFLGYCLCWGQMSYWGITVMINIFTILPLFGSLLGSYLWCSSLVVLNKIFMFHFFIGFILGFVIMFHIALLHLFSSFNLVSNNYSFTLVFYALFLKDCFTSYAVFTSMSLLLFCEPDIFGSCDNQVFANPMSTPNHIVPEWYFLVFYALLRSFPNKTAGVIIVLLFILFILFVLRFICF